MKQSATVTTALFIGWLLIFPALAGDIEDIKVLEQEHYAARNRGDLTTWMTYHMAERDSFGPDGGSLTKSTTLEAQRKAFEEQMASGTKYDNRLKDINVRVYGNIAICTSYVTGSTTSPDGKVHPVNNRRTSVLIKDRGKWKEVHDHISPLVMSK